MSSANTIFVNAVMGLTSSGFHEGTCFPHPNPACLFAHTPPAKGRVPSPILVLRRDFSLPVQDCCPYNTDTFFSPSQGTEALDSAISHNKSAYKFFGGGDTLAEFKSLSPGTASRVSRIPASRFPRTGLTLSFTRRKGCTCPPWRTRSSTCSPGAERF